MSKKEVPMFVLRLGSTDVITGDMMAMKKIREDMDVMGCPVEVGILSILMTDKSAEEIRNVFKEAAKELDDILPVVVWRADQPETCAMDMDFPHVNEMIEAFNGKNQLSLPEKSKPIHDLTIDDLLDKISRTGYDSLTDEEVTLLKKLS